MRSRTLAGILTLTIACGTGSSLQAQAQSQDAASARRLQDTSLKVQIVLVKLQGDKEVSRTPYTLTLNGDGNPVRLRLMTQVPLPTTTTTGGTDGKPATTTQSIQYKDIGTSIDCFASVTTDGSFKLMISMSDSTVYAPEGAARATVVSPAPPTIRSFSASTTVTLKDGGTDQFIVAVDKQTGEVLRANVTLNVLK